MILERISVADIAHFCGKQTTLNGFINRVSLDSRDVDENTLFIAIKGERFDANDFVEDVLEKGVKTVVCSRYDGNDERVIVVEDTGKALLNIAKGYRESFNIPFIALTGSVGKTTTKGMVFSVVNKKYNAMRTEGNLNNDIGVPKTLFTLEKNTQAAVIEMGMNHFGEISKLTRAVKPDIGIITNVGTAHIENLGSREGILKAKCEITEGMKKGSPLIINGDNDMLATLNLPDYEVLRFGIDAHNLYMKAENVKAYAEGSYFTAVCENEKTEVFVPAAGLHNVYNALCAMCVGKKLGYTLPEAAEGVRDFAPEGMRQKVEKVKEYTFIEDCYNANPDSMNAALSTLSTLKTARSIAVLGDMLELGSYSEKAHRETGAFAADIGTDIVLTFGKDAYFIADEAEKKGVKDARFFEDKKELKEYLSDILKDGDTVLFKGSRSMKTEEIFLELYREWNI